MATVAQIREWVDSTRPNDYYGKCAGLTWQTIYYNDGTSGAPYQSATAAFNATSIASKDASKAPAGAIHYWSYYGTDFRGVYGNWGHVAVDIDGGGTAVLSATKNAHEYWGNHAGLITVASQSSRAGMKYLGWSYTYGRSQRITIDNADTASGGSKPFTPSEGFLMALSDKQQAQVYDSLVVNGGQYYMPEAIVGVLRSEQQPRLDGIVARTDATNTTLAAIIAMMKAQAAGGAAEADVAEFERLLRESEARSVATTQKAIEDSASLLRAEILASLPQTVGTLTDAQVDQIAKAVTDEQAKRLAS